MGCQDQWKASNVHLVGHLVSPAGTQKASPLFHPPTALQVTALSSGAEHEVVVETRVWDEAAARTRTMRKKEGQADYRFFPEPDLPPLEVSEETIARIQVRRCLWG